MKKIKEDNSNFVTIEGLEKQEHLSIERLKALEVGSSWINFSFKTDRPKANFVDLMEWVDWNFATVCFGAEPRNKVINNRIIIDGQFLHYCDTVGAKVTVLQKDSIVSWPTPNKLEKYYVQGVFLIEKGPLKFIHAALFHKGNHNDDEISLFVIVPNKFLSEYTEFRNNYDEWVSLRDRGNSTIRVMDGEDIPYEKNFTWDDVFMPKELKDNIKQSVENFLLSKEFYEKSNIPWKRGIIFFGQAGNGKTSLIKAIISNYNFKAITVSGNAQDDVISDAFYYAEQQSPALLYFEDLDVMLERANLSSFLNMLDGVAARNGLLVVATTNNINKLQPNIIDRPSRFDRKYEIPLPDKEMAVKYMKRWFSGNLSDSKCQELASLAVQYKFSYAYLKELYISSAYNALSANRKTPNLKDIDNALKQLMDDKNLFKKSKSAIGINKYFTKSLKGK